MDNSWIFELSDPKVRSLGGGKARGLQFLQKNGRQIPKTYVVSWDAYLKAKENETEVLEQLSAEIESTLEAGRSYAVRSSANVEDSREVSFAGQFESILEVSSTEAVLEAVQQVWRSASNARVGSYLQSHDMPASDLKMAVILQEMIPPSISGVAFSRNPITGLDEIVIECVPGRGDLLVQGGIIPQRWVNKWGKWTIHPEEAAKQESELVERVAEDVREIADLYQEPADLEWVFDGQKIYWLQLRTIVALQGINIYSNRIAREVLPGIIKPLVWSVNIPLVNNAWIDIFTELIGPNDLKAEELSKAFHYRAYFNMGVIGRVFEALGMPATTLEIMMGLEGGGNKPKFRPSAKVIRHLPRLIRFIWSKARYGKKLEELIPALKTELAELSERQLDLEDSQQILSRVDELFLLTRRCAYANIVAPILMALYGKMLEKKLGQLGIDYAEFDVTRNLAELERFDPNPHLARLHRSFSDLSTADKRRIQDEGWEQLQTLPAARELHGQIQEFIKQFGHLSDSGNDFSRKPWREDPDLVLKLVVGFERTRAEVRKLAWEDLTVSGLARRRLKFIYRKARAFRYYREATGSLFTYGYGLFRNYFLALGDLLVKKGSLSSPEDIFYLRLDEIRTIVERREFKTSPRKLALNRRREIEQSRNADLPDIIYGDEAPPLEAAGEDHVYLTGIPTSRGYYKGETIVIEEAGSFDKMKKGAVLVIPFSDVAWTPLFSKAGAVVSESGGMLSHSSIVAREFGLPAVVSVTGACRRLTSGTLVSVDGYKGTVTVHSQAKVAQ
jgi:pyruvate,water dikinase